MSWSVTRKRWDDDCATAILGRSAYRFSAVTLAIVMLVPSTDSPSRIALHRLVEVCIGIGVALVLTEFWPERE